MDHERSSDAALMEKYFQSGDINRFGVRLGKITRLENPTREDFWSGLQSVSAITGKNDTLVIYFSGIGSRIVDNNGDEPGGYDRTILLEGSRRESDTWEELSQVSDDEFGAQLEEIYKESTQNIVVIFDTDHQLESVVDSTGTPKAKLETLLDEAGPLSSTRQFGVDQNYSGTFVAPGEMPCLVFMAAARDNKKSMVTTDGSLFTLSMIRTLRNSDPDSSYRDVAREAFASLQDFSMSPVAIGNIDEAVFSQCRM